MKILAPKASTFSHDAAGNIYVTYKKQRVLLTDLAEKLGLSYRVVYGRLKNGWDLKEALETPTRRKRSNRPKKL